MISLTGDVASGEKVLAAAVEGTKRTHLELGGKAPVIVFDDADLEAVVGGVRTFGFYNAGQDCTAACRIYAGPKIHDKLVADLSSAAAAHQGRHAGRRGRRDGPADHARSSARASRASSARATRSATSRSPPAARRAAGGGFFYEPTVIAGAKQSDEIVQQRSVRAGGLASRASRMRTRRSTGRTIRTTAWRHPCGRKDVGKAMKVAARLQYGCTWINTHFMLVSEMPHGGLKRSGYGKDLCDVRARGLHRAAPRDDQTVGPF